jgi:hypothetical protein
MPKSKHQRLNAGPSWFAALRTDEAFELLQRHPTAFLLAYVIAFRARWKAGKSLLGLEPGEALLGDFEAIGMTEQMYRTAKAVLKKYEFATFRTTPKGTIAKLIDTRLFSISDAASNTQTNTQPTPKQHPPNTQPTTNVEGYTDEKGRKEERTHNITAASASASLSLSSEAQKTENQPQWKKAAAASKAFREVWCEWFAAYHGESYTPTPADKTRAKEFFKDNPDSEPSELVELAHRAWEHSDFDETGSFFACYHQSSSIAKFLAALNDIRFELRRESDFKEMLSEAAREPKPKPATLAAEYLPETV